MAVYCGVCGGKAFVNESALRQHSLENKKHLQRVAEQKRKQEQPARTNTNKNIVASVASTSSIGSTVKPVAAAQYACKPCKLDFPSQDALDAHYKSGTSPFHPKCLRCGEAFRDRDLLDSHTRTAHPMVLCQPCQKFIYVEDLQKHHAESDKHRLLYCKRCDLQLSTEELLKKHYRDDGAPWHTTCFRCWEGFEDNSSLQTHIAAKHPRVHCSPCNREVFVEDLEKHWAESANHPTCPACDKSFEDQDSYKAHAMGAHEELCCKPCNLAFLAEKDLESHVAASDSVHPKCTFCGIGFRDESSLSEHVCPKAQVSIISTVTTPVTQRSFSPLPASTSEYTCELCDRTFINAAALGQHFTNSRAHPTCILCNIGFETNTEYEQHITATHPQPKPSDATPLTEVIPAAGDSPNLTDEDSVVFVAKPIQEEPIASDMSTPQSEHTDLRQLVLSIPHPIIRSSSEPPPSSAFTPRVQSTGSAGDAESQTDSWEEKENATSQAEEEAVPQSSPSTLDSPSISSVSRTPSPKLTPQPHDDADDEAISPIPSLPRSVVSPTQPHQASSPSDELTPRDVRRFPYLWGAPSLASESTSGPGTPSLARGLIYPSSNLFDHGRSKTPEPEREQSAPSSRASSVSSRQSSRPKSARTSASHSTTSHTRVEREDEPRTPEKPLQVNVPIALPAPRLSWHCRVCSGAPRDPTVTLCGHLFCRGCIILELTKHGQCPVCRAAVLVRLHVGHSD